MVKPGFRSCLFLIAAIVGALGAGTVSPAEASSGKVTVPVLLTSSRSVAFPGQYANLYAKVGVGVDGGTLAISDELGNVIATGPATQTLVVALVNLPCTPPGVGPCTPVGVHTYTAHYSGSSLFNGARSPEVTVDSRLFSPNLGLISSVNPSQTGKAVSFYGVVHDAYSGGSRRYTYLPKGTVTFYDGSVVIGAASVPALESAKVTVGGLSAGSHTITAVYSGDVNYAPATASITQVVS